MAATQGRDRITDGTWPSELQTCNDTHHLVKERQWSHPTSECHKAYHHAPGERTRGMGGPPLRMNTALLFCFGFGFVSLSGWLFGSIFSIYLVRYMQSVLRLTLSSHFYSVFIIF